MMNEVDKALVINVKNLITYDRLIYILSDISEEQIFYYSNLSEFVKNISRTNNSKKILATNSIFFINRYKFTVIIIDRLLIVYDNNTNELYIVGKFFKNQLILLNSKELDFLINISYFEGFTIRESYFIGYMIQGTYYTVDPNFNNNLSKVNLTISKSEFIEKCINSINPDIIKKLNIIGSEVPTVHTLYMHKLFPLIAETYENKELLLSYDNINKKLVIYIDDV